jgi:hypothetical protein
MEPSKCVAFSTRKQAAEFEKYLKSGSGRAFANRHLGRSRALTSGRAALCATLDT